MGILITLIIIPASVENLLLCFRCTGSSYQGGKGRSKGSADKIGLFMSTDKAARPLSWLRIVDRPKSRHYNFDLLAGKRGMGQIL